MFSPSITKHPAFQLGWARAGSAFSSQYRKHSWRHPHRPLLIVASFSDIIKYKSEHYEPTRLMGEPTGMPRLRAHHARTRPPRCVHELGTLDTTASPPSLHRDVTGDTSKNHWCPGPTEEQKIRISGAVHIFQSSPEGFHVQLDLRTPGHLLFKGRSQPWPSLGSQNEPLR